MTGDDWQPTASLSVLRQRAALLELARGWFRERGVLEVETPTVVASTVTDVQVHSLALADPPRFLHTSPEYPMKRLLAAGSGDIFQICHVFRAGERSRQHNPEFTMIEWYRLGFDLPAIMTETAGLAARLIGRDAAFDALGYADAFREHLRCDPFEASDAALAGLCVAHGLATSSVASSTRDDLLDFLVATVIGPQLGRTRLACLHHFPASQAALAQLDRDDPRTALRFELYADGMELANGYVELASATEQRRRFAADLAERRRRGLPPIAEDSRLLAALAHGLPPCAGVAMGFDRILMRATDAARIDDVLAFPWDRA